MSIFTMHVQSATQYEHIEGVTSFIGEDESGSFGIRAHHVRMMTALTYGLARYRLQDSSWRYLAFPRGILYFVDNALYISTRRFLHDADYQRISAGLLEQLLKEEEELRVIKESLFRLEQEMFRRLWQMGRGGTAT
ncbi:MAG: F0F1 ATP synthase subunit epsilon [Gallionellaceae bacterium]|nr:MAG: F0F1 ATP synthase subunit epsilon [Gallionellaceae bacterium]